MGMYKHCQAYIGPQDNLLSKHREAYIGSREITSKCNTNSDEPFSRSYPSRTPSLCNNNGEYLNTEVGLQSLLILRTSVNHANKQNSTTPNGATDIEKPLLVRLLVVISMAVRVVVAVVVVVMLILAFGLGTSLGTDIAGNELVKAGHSLNLVLGEKADSDLPDTADLASHARAYGVLDAPGVLHRPCIWHDQVDIDQVVLPRLSSANLAHLDFVAWVKLLRERLGNLAADGLLDLVVDAAICKLLECGPRVAPAGLDNQEGDQQTTRRVEPSEILQEIRAHDDEQRNDARETIDSMMNGVGSEDGGFAFAGDFHS